MAQRYVVIDLETTGNSVKKGDKIIQFAAVVVEDNKIIEEYSTFMNPGKPLSSFIEELTGIQEEQLAKAPLFAEVAPKIISLLENACFVAHNVLFDLSFLQDELLEAGYEGFFGSTIDTVELAKIMRPGAASYKLSQLAETEGVGHDRPHQADSDAYATAELFILFTRELSKFPLVTMKQLHKLSQSLKSEISELIGDLLDDRMKHSPIHHPNLMINKGIAFRRPVADQLIERNGQEEYPLTAEEKTAMIKQAFAHFEPREDQLKMMDDVYDVITNDKIAMIEAGTGLGKTLGYLLPAAYMSVQRHAKVIISTYTIELQNQLLHKELPNLRESIPFPINTVVIKGRSNYISLAKFDRVLRIREDNYDSNLTRMQILVWLLTTETGDKDELNLTSGGELFWEKLQNGIRLENAHQASWEPFEFYERAKASAEEADILITNHAYLMTNYFFNPREAFENATIIIDEAHQLESAALKHLGTAIDYVSIKMVLNKVGVTEQKLLTYRLKQLAAKQQEQRIIQEIERRTQESAYELDQFFHMLSRLSDKERTSNETNALNLQKTMEKKKMNRPLQMIAERLAGQFNRLSSLFDDFVTRVVEREQLGKSQIHYISEAYSISQFLSDKAREFTEFFIQPKADFLYWIEWNRNSPVQYASLYSQPILAANALWKQFFSRQKSVVLTSSTLTVKGSFSYMKDKLGIEQSETFMYPSPFDFRSKVKMLVADDLPEVIKVNTEEYARSLALYIKEAALACKGRMLVLFTSHEMLRTTHEELKNLRELEDFNLLSHGVTSNSKTRLIKYFQNFDKSILLGTAGFWDGLDLPGETLQCLMMVRLPFTSPKEPIHEARCKQIEAMGGNPFAEYSLPEAIMKFRQGFGRLIRTRDDKGIFIICDKRVTNASYGKDFISSLPEMDREGVQLGSLQKTIKSWLPHS
ncbi:MAG: ATP-dependent DNA helicase DinG [Bacillus sp. (in: firmicutes)]